MGFNTDIRILTNPQMVLFGSPFYRDMDRYKIKLENNERYMIQENFSFSKKDMEATRNTHFTVMIYSITAF